MTNKERKEALIFIKNIAQTLFLVPDHHAGLVLSIKTKVQELHKSGYDFGGVHPVKIAFKIVDEGFQDCFDTIDKLISAEEE